ncbi:MAG: Pr6Pr family membrane protein [Ilyomonas sp.]
MQTTTQRYAAAFIAAMCWFALVIQFWLILDSVSGAEASILAIVRYFSFFTILTNLAVAISCTAKVFSPYSFFARNDIIAALTVYILIVGIVYNIFLRSLWQPQGWQLLADILLHDATPLLYFLFWLFFISKEGLKWKFAFMWLLYPFVYIIYIFLRGAILVEYPYPFIDINQIGYQRFIVNSFGLLFAFVIASLLIIAIGKILDKRSSKTVSL